MFLMNENNEFLQSKYTLFQIIGPMGGGGGVGGGAGKERVDVKGQKLLDLMAYKLPSSCLTPHYVNAL